MSSTGSSGQRLGDVETRLQRLAAAQQAGHNAASVSGPSLAALALALVLGMLAVH